MGSILDRYGIKEVADVTFYKINKNGTPGAPVLFLDTLKVSTIEQTAETTSARGGKGNAELIMWDYGKEISVNLEDALFSPKSMALMFGVDTDDAESFGAETSVLKTVKPGQVKDFDSENGTAKFMVNGFEFDATGVKGYDESGKEAEGEKEIETSLEAYFHNDESVITENGSYIDYSMYMMYDDSGEAIGDGESIIKILELQDTNGPLSINFIHSFPDEPPIVEFIAYNSYDDIKEINIEYTEQLPEDGPWITRYYKNDNFIVPDDYKYLGIRLICNVSYAECTGTISHVKIKNLSSASTYYTGNIAVNGQKITVSADKFPGTYYITGTTFARSSVTGQDEFFDFIIPKAKMQSEVTLTMEAEGDPTTFTMNMKVLRPANGEMMKLVKYRVPVVMASGEE